MGPTRLVYGTNARKFPGLMVEVDKVDYEFLMDTILKFLDEGVLVVDREAHVTFLNEPAGTITGIDCDKALGQSIFDIFPGLTQESSTLYRVLTTGRPLIDFVQTYVNHKGKTVSKVTSTIPLFQEGVCIGALEIYREISHLKKLMERLSQLEKELYYKKSSKKGYVGNGTTYGLEDIIGVSESVKMLKRQILKVADSKSSILIFGETGTGKELAVQSIHNTGALRKSKPFIAQNCAAIPYSLLESILFGTTVGSFTGAQDKPGLFELANGGTLFLDEINSMDMDLQAKLLRVLQDGVVRRIGDGRSIQVDVRVIAATNEDPKKMVADGRLREDLYYRLNVISLCMTPLRERIEDIPVLVDNFIQRYNKDMGMTVRTVDEKCFAAFKEYHWPGNIRELQYTIERMMNFADGPVLSSENLPLLVKANNVPVAAANEPESIGALVESMNTYERELIKKAIVKAQGNYAEAARILEIPRQTLHNKIKKYGLKLHVDIR